MIDLEKVTLMISPVQPTDGALYMKLGGGMYKKYVVGDKDVTIEDVLEAKVTPTQLEMAAQKNSLDSSKVIVAPLESIVPTKALPPEMPPGLPMLFASDTAIDCGASVVLYDGFLDYIQKRLGDFYLIPSSLSEWLLIPMKECRNAGVISALSEMIKMINLLYVSNRKLSDSLMKYTKKEGLKEAVTD